MAIYRGPGGSGDAVNDAASEVLLVIQARDAAIAAQASAEAAKTAAELAETNAETAEINAETAETNAETAATNAAASASAASTSATNAANSASSASTSATNAANSASAAQAAETNAETAETNAAASASAAATSASNAATSATNAANSASAASTSATNASNSASAAATSATNAANSATAAQTAETNAETAETNAAASASAASTSASNAASSASAASTSASNAASSASAASTSATNAASSATSASNSATTATTQATNASNSASAALTSENNAASSASAAATSASNAATSATAASNSASAAATSETNAANSASAASTSATNAANSASAASTSASNAATSESNAATSASNAANSASAASTSASNASTSASNAASSASAAAASYDSFDDRYLGAKSSAPTLDNDGNTLLVGALYFDTVSSSMKVWSGSAWLDAYASLSGALIATNNLSDLTNTATARDNLGVEIGVDVQAYDATILKSADIGVSVQGYDADTAKYDDVTANFTGTLQNGGSNVVVDSDIGVTVQAYDAQLADVAGLTPADNNFIVGNGTNFVTESGSTARTSLGLGTIATQDANNVAVTGGSINGTAIGGSTAAAGTFTSLTDSGNLAFTGTGNRITGDFSNATLSNRVAFQTSTTNGNSVVSVLPNGTANIASYDVFNTSDPTNSVRARFGVSATALSIESSISGTGSYVPMIFQTGGSERLRIDTSGNVGIGTTSTLGNSLLNVAQGVVARNASTTMPYFQTYNANAGTDLKTWRWGGDSSGALAFETVNDAYSSANERMRIDSSGNVGIGTSSFVWSNAGRGLLEINGSTDSLIALKSNNTTQMYMFASTSIAQINATANIPMAFYTNNTERMRIDSSGNVGVGTSNPGVRLDVSGTIRSTSATIADAATITPTAGTTNQYTVTALAQAATIAAPSGTPIDGQKLTIRLKDNGVARALTWTTSSGAYRAIGVTLPTTTSAGKVTYVGCIYNSQDSFWDVIAVTTQA